MHKNKKVFSIYYIEWFASQSKSFTFISFGKNFSVCLFLTHTLSDSLPHPKILFLSIFFFFLCLVEKLELASVFFSCWIVCDLINLNGLKTNDEFSNWIIRFLINAYDRFRIKVGLEPFFVCVAISFFVFASECTRNVNLGELNQMKLTTQKTATTLLLSSTGNWKKRVVVILSRLLCVAISIWHRTSCSSAEQLFN